MSVSIDRVLNFYNYNNQMYNLNEQQVLWLMIDSFNLEEYKVKIGIVRLSKGDVPNSERWIKENRKKVSYKYIKDKQIVYISINDSINFQKLHFGKEFVKLTSLDSSLTYSDFEYAMLTGTSGFTPYATYDLNTKGAKFNFYLNYREFDNQMWFKSGN